MNAGSGPLSYRSRDRVAVTGLGAVCSLGHTVSETVEGFLSGKSGAGEIAGCDSLAARVKNLPIFKTDVPSQLVLTMGNHLSLLMASVDEALRGAAFDPGMIEPADRGFFAGMGMVDYHVEDLLPAVLKSLGPDGAIDYDRFFPEGYREIYPLWPLGMLNNVAFCQASIHFGLGGENGVFCPHGDAGVMAVYEAASAVREGRAKMAVAGGVSEEISPLSLARARLKGFPGPPGFLGEAGAMFVLEPTSQAEKRGASILGDILGFGFSCEKSEAGNFASRRAISSAMRAALCDAGLGPEGVDLVMVGSFDQEEREAVREIFAAQSRPPVILTTPGAFGETLAAGPVLNAALALAIPQGATLPGHTRPVSAEFTLLVNGISCEGGCGSFVLTRPGR
ncbi:MAG: beta-ketoacyl synthase N-terminal-like domain-containing protein [Syntrophobacteraceae bacterium]